MKDPAGGRTLEDDHAYLAAIVESSDDAIIGKNLDGIITAWNRSAERIFGYSAAEAIGQHITLIIPADRLEEEFVIIGKIRAGQRINHFETVRIGKYGKLVDVSLTMSPIKNERGEIIGASKIARDITAIKEAERLSTHLAAIVDSADDSIISITLDGIIKSWNRAAIRMYGYSSEEAVGQKITLIIPPEKQSDERIIIQQIRTGQHIRHFQTLRQTKDGKMLNVSLRISPILDKREKVIGASKIAREVAEENGGPGRT